jgi:hypothetical protein
VAPRAGADAKSRAATAWRNCGGRSRAASTRRYQRIVSPELSKVAKFLLYRSFMEELIVDRTRGMAASLILTYLDQHPAVVEALRRTGVRVVAFEPERGSFFESMQRALDEAEASAPSRSLFIALTDVAQIVQTGAFELARRPEVPMVKLRSRRGAFLGYIAIGEGGVVFFDADGKESAPRPEGVIAACERIGKL